MRKPLMALMILALVAGLSTVSYAGITGSAHDFSGLGWSGGEICKPCHTPHFADTSVTDSPLWNHEVTTAIFSLYSSPTLDVTPEQPGGVSKLCLSCHDGTVALDSFGGAAGSTYISATANIGGGTPGGTTGDLSDDHPVSIEWQHQTEIPDCGNCHFTTDALPFFDGKVECATCHDAHNSKDNPKLLQKDNASSALCLTCHGK